MKKNKEISLVISGFNEEKHICNTVNKFNDILKKSDVNYEILVFDDGSIDNTYNIIFNNFKNKKNIKIFRNKINSGLGYTLHKGCKFAKYKNVTLFPGDNTYKSSGIKNLLKYLNEDKLLVGYRKNYLKLCPWHRKISSIGLRLLTVFLFKKYLKDVHGPVIYKTKTLKNYKLKSLRYNYSIELLYLFLGLKKEILYIPYEISKATISNSNAFKINNIFSILKTIYYLFKKNKLIIS